MDVVFTLPNGAASVLRRNFCEQGKWNLNNLWLGFPLLNHVNFAVGVIKLSFAEDG